jgi:dipeptidyl aminopeptidase/acylaminoacyl peptidase
MAVPGTHIVSRELLLAPNPQPSQVVRRSAELHVGAETPPLLLVHAVDDTAVPVSNRLNLLTPTRAADRPVEAHLFQEGGHGAEALITCVMTPTVGRADRVARCA